MAETKVDAFVLAGMDLTWTEGRFNLSSGIEIETVGEWAATAERTTSVTLTSQSADSLGRAIGVCPTLDISRPDSSMKTGLFCEARRGCEAGADALMFDVVGRMIAKAGLKIPDGMNAGP